jgi:hypothetical protein
MHDKPYVYIDRTGNKIYRNESGKLHRLDGPAIEYSNGDKEWFKNARKFESKHTFFEALTEKEKEAALFSEDFLNA